MMRRAKRTYKKQKVCHLAQRKFASAYPPSPSQIEVAPFPKRAPPKAEDFIEFLCVRHAPFLSSELEVFAKPLVTSQSLYDDELLGEDVTGESCQESKSTNSSPLNSLLPSEDEITVQNASLQEDMQICNNFESSEGVDFVNVAVQHTTCNELKDFFNLVSRLAKSEEAVYVISPPDDWKMYSYIQDNLKFNVKTKHIHRLQFPACENFLTLNCIEKQLENDSITKFTEIPQMGLCELDLPLLLETVNLFGGVEAVNSDQNWKSVADHIHIPKTASRRVTKLEGLYLKYILPYDLLPDIDKEKIRMSVERNKKKLSGRPYEWVNGKQTALVTFHKMACNHQSMYWKMDTNVEETEDKFWEFVSEGKRHVAAVSGEIDLATNPQAFQHSKSKCLLMLRDIYVKPDSSFKCLRKISKVNVPVLSVEGIFYTSEWCTEKHGFHILSYMHSGAEKIWYVIPEESVQLFHEITQHKKTLIHPKSLLVKGCHVARCVQKEGQYVIVRPGSYYCTISTGYSYSETVCFASTEWFLSSYFMSFKPSLTEHVKTQVIIYNAMEEVKKNPRSSHYTYFSQKVKEICSLLEDYTQKLSLHGMNEVVPLKGKSAITRVCAICGLSCYLLSAKLKKCENTYWCVKDVLHMAAQETLEHEALVIEVVFTVDNLKALINKLEEPVNPKK